MKARATSKKVPKTDPTTAPAVPPGPIFPLPAALDSWVQVDAGTSIKDKRPPVPSHKAALPQPEAGLKSGELNMACLSFEVILHDTGFVYKHYKEEHAAHPSKQQNSSVSDALSFKH